MKGSNLDVNAVEKFKIIGDSKWFTGWSWFWCIFWLLIFAPMLLVLLPYYLWRKGHKDIKVIYHNSNTEVVECVSKDTIKDLHKKAESY